MIPQYIRHQVYELHPYFINFNASLLHIPLLDYHCRLVGWALADIIDADLLLQYSWSKITREFSSTSYARSSNHVLMHEVIIGHKAPPGFDINHINRCGLDNRRENLNVITKSSNAQNKDKQDGCTSIYKGVTKRDEKWIAKITVNGIDYNLGYFDNEFDAGRIYDIHALYHHRETAYVNGNLTEYEKNWVLSYGIPAGYEATEREDRGLPECIFQYSHRSYTVIVTRGKKSLNKSFPTIEEAIKAKELFISAYEEEKEKREIDRLSKPTLNSLGEYIIVCVTKKGTRHEFIVDEEVWKVVSKFNWSLKANFYCQGKTDLGKMTLHKYIFIRFVGEIPPDLTIDHVITARKDDNRLANLRLATKSLQSHNRIKTKDSHETHRGITFQSGSYKVVVNGVYRGCFKTEEEAALAANQAFLEIHGDNAVLNTVDTSKKTTAENRIAEELITKEFIQNMKYIKDLQHIITLKKLNSGAGGRIYLRGITAKTFEDTKKLVISLLFPDNKH